nr:hypothetical protein [Tanacetum cinerariifolium]
MVEKPPVRNSHPTRNSPDPVSIGTEATPIITFVQKTPTPILTQPIITDASSITTVVPESNALSAVELRVAKLEKDVFEPKTVDHSTKALAVLKSQVPTIVDSYLDTKVGDFTIKSTDKAALEEYDLKIAIYQSIHANKSFNRNPVNHRLYHALIEALIEEENAMDKEVADTGKDHKRKHDDDDEDDDDKDPLAGPKQGKKTKRRRTKESKSSKKPSTTKETPKGKTLSKGFKTVRLLRQRNHLKNLLLRWLWMMLVMMWFVMMINHKTPQNSKQERL